MAGLFGRWVAVLAAATCWQVPNPAFGFTGWDSPGELVAVGDIPFQQGLERRHESVVIPAIPIHAVHSLRRHDNSVPVEQQRNDLRKEVFRFFDRPALPLLVPHRFIHAQEGTNMPSWSPEQLANARAIASVGRSVGASSRDILIGIMTAMQESGLRNLSYGDRDSVGLFQQRNAWASRGDRMDPMKSARMFFLGGQQGQRGLLAFKNRDGMSLTQAAQKVQVSAFPDAYAKHESEARDILGNLGELNTNTLAGQDTTGVVQQTGPTQVVQQNGDLDLFAAAGVDSPGSMGTEAAGVKSAGGAGLNAGNEMPDMSSISSMFDGMDATTPDGGSTFNDLFPKQGTVGGARDRVGQLGRQLLGTPYAWGGTDPDKGLDCSGFVQYVMRQVGVNLPRISAEQARAGKRTGLDQLQAGDLVAWDNSARNNGADHIAIYLGNGQIIEQPRPGLSVRIRTVDSTEGAYGVALNY